MKLQVFLAASALALVVPQAAAQENASVRARHAAAPATTVEDTAPLFSTRPAQTSRPAVAPGDAAPVRRPGQRSARQQTQQPQPPAPENWVERIFRGSAPQPQATRNMQRHAVARPPSDKLFMGMFYRVVPRQTVAFHENYKPGTIIVRHSERRLYYVLGDGRAVRYAIAVGREGAAWSGTSTVSNKREWPSWTPTENILKRQPDLPRFMEGGPNNPMGARALYLGQTLYRIHGTNEPWTIGDEVSSGCIRMTNEDVIDLYNRTRLGATVVVQR